MKGFRGGIIGPLRGPGSEGSEGKVLRIDRPRGRRALKFDGAFGPEGCGGGFAADFDAKGRGFAAGCAEGFPTFIVPPLAGGRWCRRHQRGTGPLAPKVLKVLRFDGPFRPESCGAASPQVL